MHSWQGLGLISTMMTTKKTDNNNDSDGKEDARTQQPTPFFIFLHNKQPVVGCISGREGVILMTMTAPMTTTTFTRAQGHNKQPVVGCIPGREGG